MPNNSNHLLFFILVLLFITMISGTISSEESKKTNTGMVFIQGGTFQMGSADFVNEKPLHRVTVSSFYLGKTEVTQAEWDQVMNNKPSQKGAGSLPVVRVSWYDCIEFCNKKSILEGLKPCYSFSGFKTEASKWPSWWKEGTHNKINCDWAADGYRLPTEAEWEFAAKGGGQSKGYKLSGGNDAGAAGWYSGNSDSRTHPVGTKQPNELGIYDMSGNVWEWCWDWLLDFSGESQTNPHGTGSSDNRVLRGGSWSDKAENIRVTIRSGGSPDQGDGFCGFRLAMSFR